MQIILRVGDIKREMTPLSHLSSSLHKLMLTEEVAKRPGGQETRKPGDTGDQAVGF